MHYRWTLSAILVAAAVLVTLAGAGFVMAARAVRGRRLGERPATIVILACAVIAAILLTAGVIWLGP